MSSAIPLGSDLVEQLAVRYRATAAFRRLSRLGYEALPAVRAGLRHTSPDVRFHCCRCLDNYLSELIAMLNDGGARVRMTTLHTLAL